MFVWTRFQSGAQARCGCRITWGFCISLGGPGTLPHSGHGTSPPSSNVGGVCLSTCHQTHTVRPGECARPLAMSCGSAPRAIAVTRAVVGSKRCSPRAASGAPVPLQFRGCFEEPIAGPRAHGCPCRGCTVLHPHRQHAGSGVPVPASTCCFPWAWPSWEAWSHCGWVFVSLGTSDAEHLSVHGLCPFFWWFLCVCCEWLSFLCSGHRPDRI